MLSFIQEFGILFLLVVVVSLIFKYLKQPTIIGYVLSGVLFSVFFKNKSLSNENIILMSELGITFLLFLMGLEFDLRSLKFMGKDILITSGLQSIVFFAVGYGISSCFGFALTEKIYLSILFMFGSTLLVAKWVEDRKETSTLHGKIILGTLIFQDILAIVALTLLNVMQDKSMHNLLIAPLKGIVLLLIAFLLSRYLLNSLLRMVSKYSELLFIFSLGVCFLFVEIAPYLGYSTTLGAFIAGITLANTIYRNEVAGNLKPLINFFNMLFFVGLGFQMKLDFPANYIWFIIVFVVACILIKPLVTYFTLRFRFYDSRTSFISSVYLAQFSEFGIIIAAAGVFAGLVSSEISSITILCVIGSMLLSSYFIKYDKPIYHLFEPVLSKVNKAVAPKMLRTKHSEINASVVLFRYYELGKELFSKLEESGKSIAVVENDPMNIDLLKKEGIKYIYGSPGNPDFFDNVAFKGTEIVISNLSDLEMNKKIIVEFKKRNPDTTIIVTAKTLRESMELYNNRADYVIYQTYLQEQQVTTLIQDYTLDIQKLISKKVTDLAKFKEKEEKIRKINEKNSKFWNVDSFLNRMIKSRR